MARNEENNVTRNTSGKSRNFRAGGYSMVITVIVIAIVIAVNLFVGELPTTWTKFDVSDTQLFTISEQTKQITATLTDPVTVYHMVQNGKEDTVVSELLKRYEALSDKITVIKRDPVLYPNFASQYTSEVLPDNSLIVVSDKRAKAISNSSIIVTTVTVDPSTYQQTQDTSFYGETELTSAIDYVTSDNLPTVYVLGGHGEMALSGAMANRIAKENIELVPLSLLSEGGVPETASCLFILNPTSDISVEEADMILDYLKRNGKMMLVTDYSDVSMPNLAAVMDYYGAERVNGFVVEGNSDNVYQNYVHYLLPNLAPHAITDPLIAGSYRVLTPISQGINSIPTRRSAITIAPLLQSSDDAYSKANGMRETLEREEGDIAGPFDLAVAISEGQTSIVWFTTSMVLDESLDQLVSGGNTSLFLNALGWLAEHASSITVHAKSLNVEALTITSFERTMWSVFFIGILPAVGLIIGGVVFYRRVKR